MKLDIKLHAGSETSDHQLELRTAGAAGASGGTIEFLLDGEASEADWAEITPGVYSILVEGRAYEARASRHNAPGGRESPGIITVGTRSYVVEVRDPRLRRHTGSSVGPEGPQDILAPMPGKIVKVLVSENQEVNRGQGLLVIEAMKMQNEIRAPRSGCVGKIYVLEGTGVETGFKLLRLV